MAKGGKSNYIKSKPLNKVVFQRTLDQLDLKVKKLMNLNDLTNESYQTHIEHLANFARHDMKNSVQSMDSILNTLTLQELTEENWDSLKACLENIRQTIDDFSKLAPIDSKEQFRLPELLVGAELLSRSLLDQNKVKYKFEYARRSEIVIHHSFHALLQLIHNLIINAVKALSEVDDKRLLISATIDNNSCQIDVLDNGEGIDDLNCDKIFEYGFSTTGGSGIGLFHAKYTSEAIGGTIELSNFADGLYSKKFTLKFPLERLTKTQ